MPVPLSSGVPVAPVAPVTPYVPHPQVIPAQEVWAKLSNDVRARAIGLFAQLALNLVLARARGDDVPKGAAMWKEVGDARHSQHP